LRNVIAQEEWSNGGCRDAVSGELCDAFGKCPFAQNRGWLSNSFLRQRFLDALRAAEIAAGRRFTYRELLEHYSLAILGRAEANWLKGIHPCEWSSGLHQKIQSDGSQEAVCTLSLHRIYLNLFSNRDVLGDGRRLEQALDKDRVYRALRQALSVASETSRPEAFENAFRTIDPARDTDPWDGARRRALDAVESLEVLPPSTQISQWAPPLEVDVHSDLESDLDRCLSGEILSELQSGHRTSTNRVRVLRRWRTVALLRQVGLALGRFSFGDAIQAWLAEQENALREGPRQRLGDGIGRLILPEGAQAKVFIAPLRPRTYCLAELPAATILSMVPVNDLKVVIVADGDSLIAEVQVLRQREAPFVLAKLIIDLPIAREALLHAEQVSRAFTEIGDTAFARIERARASLISRERSGRTAVYFTDPLGKLFVLAPAAGGGAALKVQAV
jgi:hypothetical protein